MADEVEWVSPGEAEEKEGHVGEASKGVEGHLLVFRTPERTPNAE